jgi:hypothetical protein
MATSQTDNSEMNVTLKQHTERIVNVFENTIEIAKMISEAKGNGTLNAKNKTIKFGESEIGLKDLAAYVSRVKNAIREIPRIVAKEKAAEKAAKRESKAARPSRPLPPIQYRSELVEFFKKADLGKTADGKQKLQDDSTLNLFFTNGVGNSMFGVSLFNVWGNIQKLKNGGTKVVLDSHARTVLKESLDYLKTRCRDKIGVAETDKARASAESDLSALEAGEIQNKDYMCILSFYSVKDNKDQLVGFTDKVAVMSKMTTGLNAGYRGRIKESRPKVVKAPKITASTEAPPKMPEVPVASKTSLPTIPTVGRASSPAAPTKSRK